MKLLWLRLKAYTQEYFHFEKRHTNFTNEIRGGCVTFLTMSYILLVNPQVVSDWVGGDNETLFPEERTELSNNIASGTALVCSLGTIVMGLVANFPFAVGPGMSMNSVFAGTISLATNATQLEKSRHQWDVAVTSSFFGGLIVLLLALVGLGPRILRWLPDVLKSGIRVGIGLFQCFLALRNLHIVQSEPTELLKFVDHFNFSDHGEDGPVAQILFAFSLLLTSSLYVLGVHSPILVSIVLTTIICWIFGVGGVHVPSVPIQVPVLNKTVWNYAWGAFFQDASAIGIALSFVVITLFDVGGAMFAILTIIHESNEIEHTVPAPAPRRVLDEESHEHHDEDNVLESDGLIGRRHHGNESHDEDDMLTDENPSAKMVSTSDAKRVYAVVGLATMFSSVLGCSPTVVFLECLAGVASGSRTGFSSLVTGGLFLLSLPFEPVFRNVPACAAVPALVLIGCFMLSSVGEIPWHNHKRAFPAFVTIILMPFTASITPGIIGGVICYALLEYVDRGWKRWQQWRSASTHPQRTHTFVDGVLVA